MNVLITMENTLSEQETEILSTTKAKVDLVSTDNINVVIPRRGEIRKGTVVTISSDEILIDIGYKSDGIVSQHELSKLSDGEWNSGRDLRASWCKSRQTDDTVSPQSKGNTGLGASKATNDCKEHSYW